MHPTVCRLLLLALGILLALPGHAFGAGGAAPATSETVVRGDFNGDGFADLAVGVPGDDSAETNAGAVNVIPGGQRGLTARGNQLWTEDTPGVPSGANPN